MKANNFYNKVPRLAVFAVFLTFGICNTSHSIEPEELYSWHENGCAVSCGFDESKNNCSDENPEALKYVQYVVLDAFAKIGSQKDGVCVCVTAKLNIDGTFSAVSIHRTNDIEAAEKFKSNIEKLKLSPVPSSAMCLTKDLMKFSSGEKKFTPNKKFKDVP